MDVTLENAHHYQQISRFLERIGDHAVNIAKNVLKIINKKTDKKIVEKLSKISKISLDILTKSLDAWMKSDIMLANETIEDIKKLVLACEEIGINSVLDDVQSSLAVSYIVESMSRTGEYAGDIAEIIINNLIRDSDL